jgi:hypothetical protein
VRTVLTHAIANLSEPNESSCFFAASYNQMLCPINASYCHQSVANLMPAVRCRWPTPGRGGPQRGLLNVMSVPGVPHRGLLNVMSVPGVPQRGLLNVTSVPGVPHRGLSPWQQVFDGVIGREGWSISQPSASLQDDRGKTLLVLLFSINS